MVPIPISDLKSNWQFVVFYLIDPIVNEYNRYFSSSDIIWNVEDILLLLVIRGHEQKPKNPKNILQKALQKMRDKHWIKYLEYRGEYDLTDEGYKTLLTIRPRIQYIRQNKGRLLNEAKDILKKWGIDLGEIT
jgi:glutamine synthetase